MLLLLFHHNIPPFSWPICRPCQSLTSSSLLPNLSLPDPSPYHDHFPYQFPFPTYSSLPFISSPLPSCPPAGGLARKPLDIYCRNLRCSGTRPLLEWRQTSPSPPCLALAWLVLPHLPHSSACLTCFHASLFVLPHLPVFHLKLPHYCLCYLSCLPQFPVLPHLPASPQSCLTACLTPSLSFLTVCLTLFLQQSQLTPPYLSASLLYYIHPAS